MGRNCLSGTNSAFLSCPLPLPFSLLPPSSVLTPASVLLVALRKCRYQSFLLTNALIPASMTITPSPLGPDCSIQSRAFLQFGQSSIFEQLPDPAPLYALDLYPTRTFSSNLKVAYTPPQTPSTNEKRSWRTTNLGQSNSTARQHSNLSVSWPVLPTSLHTN